MTMTTTPADARQQLNALWDALDKPAAKTGEPAILWDIAIAPPLPTTWPPKPGMDWVRYAYGHGRDIRLADGLRVARPWATITHHADGTATLIQLATALEDGGVQGFGPVGQQEQALLQTGESAQAAALALIELPAVGSPQAQLIKSYYQLWMRFNGAIAELLRANHEPFFAWLEA
jgi:hypothetical protein